MTAFEFGTAPGIKTARWRVNQADWDSWSRELDAVLQNFLISMLAVMISTKKSRKECSIQLTRKLVNVSLVRGIKFGGTTN